jgi:hypothetical protein
MAVMSLPSLRRKTGITWLIALALGMAWSSAAPRPAVAQELPEYQLKAVFLFNFAQFVEWPARSFPRPDSPLVLCVTGEDPFGAYLDDIVRGESVNGHPMEARRFRRGETISGCHILFISRSEEERLRQVVDGVKGQSTLTVGDFDGFTRGGGMIRFVMDRSRIRLRVNLAAAESVNLKLSSKLLRPAEIVSERN